MKHLDTVPPPWAPESEYAVLQSESLSWRNELPASLQFTRTAIHQRKVSNQHGALLLLHLTYHQTMCDLTRIGMRELFRIRGAVIFPVEQLSFLRQVQDSCFDNCMAVSSVFSECLKHGLEALADTWLCVVSHDASRVLVHYVTNRLGSPGRHTASDFRSKVEAALQIHVRALEKMIPIQTLARPLVSSSSLLPFLYFG